MGLEAYLGKALPPETFQELTEETFQRLSSLDRNLTVWNAAVGLSGFRTREQRWSRYFAEALCLLRFLPIEGAGADIGSGGGSPGLPLAMARRTLSIRLVESRRRKTVFLEQMLYEHRVENACVVRGRYEDVDWPSPLDFVTSRGVKMTAELLTKALGDLATGGRLLVVGGGSRLGATARQIESTGGLEVLGPEPLLPLDGGARLLVAEKLG